MYAKTEPLFSINCLSATVPAPGVTMSAKSLLVSPEVRALRSRRVAFPNGTCQSLPILPHAEAVPMFVDEGPLAEPSGVIPFLQPPVPIAAFVAPLAFVPSQTSTPCVVLQVPLPVIDDPPMVLDTANELVVDASAETMVVDSTEEMVIARRKAPKPTSDSAEDRAMKSLTRMFKRLSLSEPAQPSPAPTVRARKARARAVVKPEDVEMKDARAEVPHAQPASASRTHVAKPARRRLTRWDVGPGEGRKRAVAIDEDIAMKVGSPVDVYAPIAESTFVEDTEMEDGAVDPDATLVDVDVPKSLMVAADAPMAQSFPVKDAEMDCALDPDATLVDVVPPVPDVPQPSVVVAAPPRPITPEAPLPDEDQLPEPSSSRLPAKPSVRAELSSVGLLSWATGKRMMKYLTQSDEPDPVDTGPPEDPSSSRAGPSRIPTSSPPLHGLDVPSGEAGNEDDPADNVSLGDDDDTHDELFDGPLFNEEDECEMALRACEAVLGSLS
ncbi:hypothetical protein B0H21DRAFT_444162 [Amylocystis lapponica]|nr:hypothetical protein B0H21DRAFT_444162 [Amylocystis lapponica]